MYNNKKQSKLKAQTDKIILGIDPGTQTMGYGLIQIIGNKLEMITMGIIDLKKYEDHYLRMQKIFSRVLQLIDEYNPDEMALEAPFYGKNVQSMLKLGRAQGVAMAAGLFRSIPIAEYSPRKIKQAITGNGNATKEQVAAFLKTILFLKEIPTQLDASDGLAAAVCHHLQGKTRIDKTKFTSWKDFLNKNPGRIVK